MARGLVAGTVLLAGFLTLSGLFADAPAVIGFDETVGGLIQSWRSAPLTALMVGITTTGSTPAVIMAAVAFTALFYRAGRRVDAAFTGLLVASIGVFSALTKRSFARVRPPVENALVALPASFSFPSGHTMGSIGLACVVGYLAFRADWAIWQRLAVIGAAVLYTVAVGVSRVYLGVHWPSDVVAAWMLGGALASVAIGVYEALRESRAPTGPVAANQ